MTDNQHYPEPSVTKRAAVDMHIANRAIHERILKMGIEVTGLDNDKGNALVAWLYDNLMTEAQREDFELSYETGLNAKLKEKEKQARDFVVQQQAAVAKRGGARPSGLVVPGRDVRVPGRS